MPRRSSRAQLIHLLADEYATIYRHVYGDHRAYPQDFYERFTWFSDEELKEYAAAAGLTPRRRGRSKRKSYLSDAALFEEVNLLRKRHSERRACEIVAHRYRTNAIALRMRYRRSAKG